MFDIIKKIDIDKNEYNNIKIIFENSINFINQLQKLQFYDKLINPTIELTNEYIKFEFINNKNYLDIYIYINKIIYYRNMYYKNLLYNTPEEITENDTINDIILSQRIIDILQSDYIKK